MNDVKKHVAELIGTFVLVFMGCGSAVLAGGYIGLSVLAMAYAVGGISGCHINPAISISMLATGKMKLKDTVIYIVMQCVGAIIAATVLYVVAIGKQFHRYPTL